MESPSSRASSEATLPLSVNEFPANQQGLSPAPSTAAPCSDDDEWPINSQSSPELKQEDSSCAADDALEEDVATILTHLDRISQDVDQHDSTLGSGSMADLDKLLPLPGCVSDTTDGPADASSSHAQDRVLHLSSTTLDPGCSQKRKSLATSGADGLRNDGVDDRGWDSAGPSKCTKRVQSHGYGCPVARKFVHTGPAGTINEACTSEDLGLMNLWDHMAKSHFGCEKCGKQLKNSSQALRHVWSRQADSETCQPNHEGSRYEISIELWQKLEAVYQNESLSNDRKWSEWWNLLCPGAYETRSLFFGSANLSMNDVPRIQQIMETLWQATPGLPHLDEDQRLQISGLLSWVFRLLLRESQLIKQQQPRCQETDAVEPPEGQQTEPLASGEVLGDAWLNMSMACMDDFHPFYET